GGGSEDGDHSERCEERCRDGGRRVDQRGRDDAGLQLEAERLGGAGGEEHDPVGAHGDPRGPELAGDQKVHVGRGHRTLELAPQVGRDVLDIALPVDEVSDGVQELGKLDHPPVRAPGEISRLLEPTPLVAADELEAWGETGDGRRRERRVAFGATLVVGRKWNWLLRGYATCGR